MARVRKVRQSDAEQADYNAKITAAAEIGVDRLSVDKLLSLMGWRADVKSVMLGSGTSANATAPPKKTPAAAGAAKPTDNAAPAFRKRTPPRGTDGAF